MQGKTGTDAQEFLSELDGGMFAQKLGKIISQAAASTMEHERKSKITVTFEIKQIGGYQVYVSHKIDSAIPVKRGTKKEDDLTGSSMYFSDTTGRVSAFPEKPFGKDAQGNLITEEHRR